MKETTVKSNTSTSTLKKEHKVLIGIHNRGTSDIVGVGGSALLGSVVWTEISKINGSSRKRDMAEDEGNREHMQRFRETETICKGAVMGECGLL